MLPDPQSEPRCLMKSHPKVLENLSSCSLLIRRSSHWGNINEWMTNGMVGDSGPRSVQGRSDVHQRAVPWNLGISSCITRAPLQDQPGSPQIPQSSCARFRLLLSSPLSRAKESNQNQISNSVYHPHPCQRNPIVRKAPSAINIHRKHGESGCEISSLHRFPALTPSAV